MEPINYDAVHHISGIIEKFPAIKALLILMAFDIFSGIGVAFATRTLSSTISFKGMCKKAMVFIIIGTAATLEPYANGLPLTNLVALCYIVTEALSILENASALGVPLPAILVESLMKLREKKAAQVQPNIPAPILETHIHTPKPVTVVPATDPTKTTTQQVFIDPPAV